MRIGWNPHRFGAQRLNCHSVGTVPLPGTGRGQGWGISDQRQRSGISRRSGMVATNGHHPYDCGGAIRAILVDSRSKSASLPNPPATGEVPGVCVSQTAM